MGKSKSKKSKKYSLWGQSIMFYDYETTGLKVKLDELVSVFATNPILGVTIDSLTRPKCAISAEASAVNGISEIDLLNAYPNEVLIKATANLWNHSDIVCGWNILGYDSAMTFSLCERENVIIDRMPLQLDLKYVCKLLLNAEELKAHSDNPYSLVNVYSYLFDETFDAHDAKADVMAVMRIFNKIKKYIQPCHLLSYQSVFNEVITDESTRLIQGKHLGETIGDVLVTDPKYIKWLIKEKYIILSNTLLIKHNLC